MSLDEVRNLVDGGDYKGAKKLLVRLVRENPKDIEAWLLLASVADPDDQRRCLEYVLTLQPDHPAACAELERLNLLAEEPEAVTQEIAARDTAPLTTDEQGGPQFNTTDEKTEQAQSEEEPEADDLPADMPPADEPPQPLVGPWKNKRLTFWDQPFRTEGDMIEQFEGMINVVLEACDARKELPIGPHVSSLKYALRRYQDYRGGTVNSTNAFLTPAFKAILPIARELYRNKDDMAAAWMVNQFTEMGKILILRARADYNGLFRDYLQLYCDLFEVNFEMRKDGALNETDELERRLRTILGFALGTNFSPRGYQRNYQPDKELIDSLVDETLARHFDWRLNELLQNYRPSVWPFVVDNMPKIYRLRLSDYWDQYMGDTGTWETALKRAGFDDSLRRNRGLFTIPSRIGRIHPDDFDQIRDAGAVDDFNRVRSLMAKYADEVKSFLEDRARQLLSYREPTEPRFNNRFEKERFDNALKQAARENYLEAVSQVQSLWEKNIANNELREWMAYLHLKNGNVASAEPMLDRLQKIAAAARKEASYATDWNMAVLLYDRHDDAGAYKLLLPWVERNLDEELIDVILYLALRTNDKTQFISLIPRTKHLRYHALAFSVANDLHDEKSQKKFLGQLLYQGGDVWELPSIHVRYTNPDELKAVISKAIVENQTDQLITWLKDRIQLTPFYIPNYLELATVFEMEKLDTDSAYFYLEERIKQEAQKKQRNQARVEEACGDLLDLCRRHRRQDLGEKAYKRAEAEHASEELLASYAIFKKSDPAQVFRSIQERLNAVLQETPRNPERISKISRELLAYARDQMNSEWGRRAFHDAEDAGAARDVLTEFKEYAPFGWQEGPGSVGSGSTGPGSTSHGQTGSSVPTDKIISVTSDLRRIRSVAQFGQYRKVISDLIEIIQHMNPVDSPTVVKLIQDFSSVIDGFANTPKDRKDERRLLYERASYYQKNLSDLLARNLLDQNLTKLLQAFDEGTLRPVVGDLTRQVGVGPNIDAEIENPFLSLEANRSTLVVRLRNISYQQVTSIFLHLMTEGDLIWLEERGERIIERIEPDASCLVAFPYELKQSAQQSKDAAEVVVRLTIRASAEGYPNVDLGDVRRAIPIKTFQQQIGRSSIPILFKPGAPLTDDEAGLFQGRQEVIEKIKESFYEGKQGERFFLDGIRRVGKTSLLNFLPHHLPENLIPVKIDFEGLGITTEFSSAQFLYTMCDRIFTALPEPEGMPVLPLDEARFMARPATAFQEFFRAVKRAYPDKMVFLMVDEFQVMLSAMKTTAIDSLALDQIRSNMDDRLFYAMFTGSTRYDRLARIYEHRIIGSLSRLRISFLSRDDVSRVIRAGMEKWVKVPDESVQAIYNLSGGYPRLVHTYGSEIVSVLNRERRTIFTPDDVEKITREEILNNDELFSHLWPSHLTSSEETFIEHLMRQIGSRPSMGKNEFFETVSTRNIKSFNDALDNLRGAEVLDSTVPDLIRFSGGVVRRWIEQHIDSNGQLRIPRHEQQVAVRGAGGVFIDHENLAKTLEEISEARGVPIQNRLEWFQGILKNLMAEAESRIGYFEYRVTVAFWNRAHEAALTPAYALYNFLTHQPLEMKENAADFKLATEVEAAVQSSIEKGNRITRAIVITGDGDLSQTVLKLKNDGVQVQVWGGRKKTNQTFLNLIGPENVVRIEDVCGL